MDLIERAKAYLAMNAAESGADVLIAELIEEVGLWKDRCDAERQAHEDTMKQADETINSVMNGTYR